MKRVIAYLLLVVAGMAQTKSFTKSPAKVPQPELTVSDPAIRVVLSNSQVRVVSIDLAPHASTQTTRRDYDFILLSLNQSEFDFVGANTVHMSMQPNELQVLNGRWSHRVVNSGDNAIHLVLVEVKRGISPEQAICGLNAKTCTESRFAYEKTGGYVSGTLFETPSIKLSRVEIDPDATMPEHGHKGSEVLVALTDQQLSNAVMGGDVSDIRGRAGDATWLAGNMVHQVRNRGASKVQFLEIECK